MVAIEQPHNQENRKQMRGDDLQQTGMFSYLSPEHRVPQDHPLRAIRKISDAVFVHRSKMAAAV